MNNQPIRHKKHFFIALSLMLIAAILSSGVSLPVYAEDLVTPIPPGPDTTLPDYTGAPAKPHPTANSGVPQNPLLAPNPFNGGHLDPWQSDAADIVAPLGLNPETRSTTLEEAQGEKYPDSAPWIFACEAMLFDSHGRLIGVCFSPSEATVVVVNPDSLEVLAYYPLSVPEGYPYVKTGRQALLKSMGAIYSYVDNLYRFNVVAQGNQIYSLIEEGTKENFELKLDESRSFDLQHIFTDPDSVLTGVLLDSQGRTWFTTAGSAVSPPRVYVLNPAKSTHPYMDVLSNSLALGNGELIRNSFALTKTGNDSSAAYVVTSKNMYRIDAGPDDKPYVVWVQSYDNTNETRDGQYELGSGTTPTILGEGRYVAITDNAEQMQVVVYRTDELLDLNEERVVCEVPVFDFPGGGFGALSNSLIGSRLSLIASNNYGYWFDWETGTLLQPSAPGLERIDIDPNGKGCTKVWTNQEIATTTSPRLSTRTGLIYTMAREYDSQNNVYVYYWTALDFRTGETVWQKMAGTGSMYDGFYTAMELAPNGALYYGGYGGFMTIRDTQGENIMSRTTEQVFQAHLSAVQSGDVQQVTADYADDALLMTVDGAYVGKDAIQTFFTDQFNSQSIVSSSIDHLVLEDDTILVEWSAESVNATLPRAVDTYIIQGGKIIRHTTWFRWIPK